MPGFRTQNIAPASRYKDVIRVSRRVMGESVHLKEGERVLIITNPNMDTDIISRSLYHATEQLGGRPVLMYQPVKTQADFRDYAIQKAIESDPDVLISISQNKLGKDELGLKGHQYRGPRGGVGNDLFHLLLDERVVRGFWSPTITLGTYLRAADIDYKELRGDADKLGPLLTIADEIRIETEAGTSLRISLKGRKSFIEDGDYSHPGLGGNMPAGECFISPAIGSTEGVCVFDAGIGTFKGNMVRPETPVRLVFDGGYVDMSSIEGGKEAGLFKETIEDGMRRSIALGRPEDFVKNSRHLGEVGIGLNKKARIVANVLESEKVRGKIHLAIGYNYDRDAEAAIHYDHLMHRPTVTLIMPNGDEHKLMDDGKLSFDYKKSREVHF